MWNMEDFFCDYPILLYMESKSLNILRSKPKPKTCDFKGSVDDGYMVTGYKRRDVRLNLQVGTINQNKRIPLLKPTIRI